MKSRIKLFTFLIASICLLTLSFATAKEKNKALFEENFKLYRQLESNSEKAKRSDTWDLVGSTFYRLSFGYLFRNSREYLSALSESSGVFNLRDFLS